MEKKIKRKNISCKSCDKLFVVSKDENIISKEYTYCGDAEKVKGKVIDVTSFICPHCGREYVIQVDDVYSKDLLTEILVHSKSKKSVRKQKKVKELLFRLSVYRHGIMRLLNGSKFKNNENGEVIELGCRPQKVEENNAMINNSINNNNFLS